MFTDILKFLGGDASYHFKILVPSTAAGAIIGKGGETIAQLQKDAGTRIKMSKANDFYPGTWNFILLNFSMVSQLGQGWHISEIHFQELQRGSV